MNADLSLFHLISNASTLVQLIMLVLLSASIMSWMLIFKKAKQLKSMEERLHYVEAVSDKADWGKMNEWVLSQRDAEGIVALLRQGLRESMRFALSALPSQVQGDYLKQWMQTRLVREAQLLEQGIPFLATVGSVSPYVGLFGTVWGIMMAFKALGASTAQATLAMVAPGIAEALIATAMGLFAAIPAVIAYNRFQYWSQTIAERYDLLVTQFCYQYARYAESRTDTGAEDDVRQQQVAG